MAQRSTTGMTLIEVLVYATAVPLAMGLAIWSFQQWNDQGIAEPVHLRHVCD